MTAPYEAQRSNKAIDDTKNPFWEDDSFSCPQGIAFFLIIRSDQEKSTKKPLASFEPWRFKRSYLGGSTDRTGLSNYQRPPFPYQLKTHRETMTTQPQQSSPIQNNYYPDDEIELIDYLRVLWKWKWLIIMGMFLCTLVAFIYGFTHSAVKMYKVSTFVELDPKVTGSPDKIKSSIEAGIFNAQILKDLSSSSAPPNMVPLAFEISIPDGLNILHIVYNTPDPDVGKAVSGSLVKQIEESYKERIEQVRSEIDNVVKTKESSIKDIEYNIQEMKLDTNKQTAQLAQEIKKINDHITLTEKKNEKDILVRKNSIKSSVAKIKALKENVGRIENTMVYMKKVLQQAELSAEKLVSKIESSFVDPQDSADHENLDIRVSAIQQLVNHPVTLRNQIDSLVREKEKFLTEILSEENRIEELEAEIELLKIEHNFIIYVEQEKIKGIESELQKVKRKENRNISDEERKIAKLKSEIESLKRDRDHVIAISMKQNPTVSPLPIKSKIKQKVLLAGVVGLFFFVFLAFFIEYIKNASKSSPANKET
ncbi:MAG: Wzz/FepE/Etk N-terminal domain-containing protein [archaeon]